MIKIVLFYILYTVNTYAQIMPESLQPFHKDLTSDINFKNLAPKYKTKYSNIVIKLVDKSEISKFGDFAVGACIREYDLIIFDSTFIQTATTEPIQEVFDHEFGHCVLGRTHPVQKAFKANHL